MHPLDLAEARRDYLVAALLRTFVSPVVLVAMMLWLWAISPNVITPVIGAVVGLTVTAYAERRFRSDAWSHVPCRRQDAGRDEPARLAIPARAVELLLLAGGLAAFGSAVGTMPAATSAASVALGAVAALALVLIVAMVWDHLAPRDQRFLPMPALAADAFTLACLLLLGWAMLGIGGRVGISFAGAAAGFAIVAATVAMWLSLRLIPTQFRCLPASMDLP